MRIWIILVLAIQPVFAAPVAGNEETDLLKRRVQQLEQQTQTLQKKHELFVDSITKTIKEGALAQDSALELEKQLHSKLQTSGYADVEFRNSSNKDSYPSFRIHHFSLIFSKEIDAYWRTFAEVEYEDAPRVEFEPGSPGCLGDCSGQIFVEAMNVNYSPSEAFDIRLGRFFTPAGIWSIDHYPPFVPTQERPLHIRHMFPQVIDGAQLHGIIPFNEVFFNYDIYVGNGESSNGHSDNDKKKSRGLRIATQLPWLTLFEVGASAYADTVVEEDDHKTRKLSTGFHTKIRHGVVALQTEIAQARFQPQGEMEHTADGYYAQLGYDTSAAATIGYRYEFFEDYNEDEKGDISLTEKKRKTYFINYRVHKNVVLKLEHHVTSSRVMMSNDTGEEELTVASVAVYLGE